MKLREVELLTDSIVETERFYCEQLGFQVATQTADSISFIAGKSILRFAKSQNVNPQYHFAFNIPMNKINEAISWASTKVTLIKNSDNEIVTKFQNWNAESIYFYDNNKNILELIARFDLHNASQEYFSAASIESISEIGIVTDQPLSLSEDLIRNHGLSYFSKGPKRDDFTALGDDRGLILIAKTKREWYPTENLAQPFFTRIKFSVDHIVQEITFNDIMRAGTIV